MANRKRDAGREALEKKGWWRSHRWLVLRRLCQFFVLGMFLSGPWFGVWILHGNYSSSLLFDTVPLTDPLMTLQSLASGHLPATVALTGAVIITVLYALAGKRLFCSWVCPLNPITDLANWLRRRFDLNPESGRRSEVKREPVCANCIFCTKSRVYEKFCQYTTLSIVKKVRA